MGTTCLLGTLALTLVSAHPEAPGTRPRTLKGHGGSVMAVAFAPDGTTLASGSRDVRAGEPTTELEPGVERLLGLQREDGGWGQERGPASDADATGQALYFLSLAGLSGDRPEIRRAVTYLGTSQKEDGSWPMTSRAQPGAASMPNPVPITYFGSAWATLGLMRSLPTPQRP